MDIFNSILQIFLACHGRTHICVGVSFLYCRRFCNTNMGAIIQTDRFVFANGLGFTETKSSLHTLVAYYT